MQVLLTFNVLVSQDMKHGMLRSSHEQMWPAYVRIGILAILQNRVGEFCLYF